MKRDDSSPKESTVVNTETDSISTTTTTTTNKSTDSTPEKEFEDLLSIAFLFLLAVTLLYIFIRYLLRKRKNNLLELSEDQGSNSRRHRFGRMRKNSNHRAWLDPLESLNIFQYPTEFESEQVDSDVNDVDVKDINDDDDDDDADQLIQSNISREFIQSQLDPFALKSGRRRRKSTILKNWDLGDFVGIGLAAGCAFLFIFILSNIEEWIE